MEESLFRRLTEAHPTSVRHRHRHRSLIHVADVVADCVLELPVPNEQGDHASLEYADLCPSAAVRYRASRQCT